MKAYISGILSGKNSTHGVNFKSRRFLSMFIERNMESEFFITSIFWRWRVHPCPRQTSFGPTNGETVRLIKKFSDKTLTNIELFDIYEGAQLELGKKSMAYHLTFSNLERSLTLDEVDGFVDKILKGLAASGINLR